ncbi:hypothetical protein predicted by Glimmer/Critica [Lactiplantibacillus plantarum]|nr:hypothetical protein predicted by Glimmer/Critica [Lactiplantibacillus plantarum]
MFVNIKYFILISELAVLIYFLRLFHCAKLSPIY